MKLLKNLLCVVVFFVVMAGSQNAIAQTTGQGLQDKTPEQKAQLLTIVMKTKLSLDSTQVRKVQPINLRYLQGVDALKKSTDSKLAKFNQYKSIKKDNEADLKAVLTPDQFKQYQEMQGEMIEKMKERKGAASGQ